MFCLANTLGESVNKAQYKKPWDTTQYRPFNRTDLRNRKSNFFLSFKVRETT